ncbi:MAG: SpoIIE family protein phosphatase [Clostridia bacterium]|nr:SpoIIE family protein phosphatase [Clostridia bacterium]
MELGLYGNNKTDAYEKGQKTGIKEKLAKINYLKASYFVLMFFSSRIILPGGIMPFGLAFFAAEYLDRAHALPTVIVLSAAALSPETMPAVFRCCVSIVLFSVAARRWEIGKAPLSKGIVMSICAFLAGFIQKVGGGISLYDVSVLIFESGILIISVYLFSGAKSVFFGGGDTKSYGAQDMICISAFLSLSLIGLGLPHVLGFDPNCFFCALLLLALAYKNPAATGAVAGVIIGLIYGFYEGNMSFILSAFALSAVFCGFFGKFGRAAAALSFITAYSLAAYNSLSLLSFLLMLEAVTLASLTFILLPEKALRPFAFVSEKRRSYADKLRELTFMDITDSANAIHDVAEIFESVSENRLLGTEAAVSGFFEKTARRICDDCPRKNTCWRHEFHRTYTSFYVLLQLCEKNGRASRADIPDELLTKCQRRDNLCDAVNNMFEVYKTDKLWESRVNDSRIMLSKQLMCISDRLLKTAGRVKSPGAFDSFKESSLSMYLSEQGIKTERIYAVNNRIIIILDKGETDALLVDGAVSRCLGYECRTVKRLGNVLYLAPAPGLKIKVGKAAKNKNDNPLSGDSSSCMFVDGNKYFMALSDGMGSGERAGRDSRAAVTIASKMLAAGFDIENTVSMINSVLVLKSAETSFATLDMAIIDLKRGVASFYKSGAAASFIKRGENVFPVSSASLPSGSLPGADIENSSHKIKEGDVIFMVSDGVTSAGAARISEIISKMDISSPDEMAMKLLNKAAALGANIISDDMTVLAASVGKAG